MNGMGRGPYRTLAAVLDACDRPNPFVKRAVDAATQYMEDSLQKWVDEMEALGLTEVSLAYVQRQVGRTRNELYRYLAREVPRDGQPYA